MNEQNLKPFTSDQSHEEAVKNGRKGGLQNGRNWEFKKLFNNVLDEKIEINGKPLTRKELLVLRMTRIASDPEARDKDVIEAFKTIRDTIGEKPMEKIMLAEVEQSVIDEVERMVLGDDEGTSG